MTRVVDKKVKTLEILIIIKVLLSFIPFLGYYSPAGTNLLFETLIIIIILTKVGFNRFLKVIVSSIPILLILIISYYLTPGGLGYELYMIFKYLLWAIIVYWIILYDKTVFAKTLLRFIIIAFIITNITTVIGNQVFPGASRFMAVGTYMKENPTLLPLYMMYNIGDFLFVYSCVLFIPVLVYLYKIRVIGRYLPLALVILILLMTISTEYTTAILVSFLSSSLFFIKKKLTTTKIVLFSTIAIIVFVVASNTVSGVFYSLANSIESESVSSRFVDIADVLSGTDLGEKSDLNSRMERNQISIETIQKSPIIGSGGNLDAAGGHSLILDYIALYGIFGIILELIVFFSIYKKCVKTAFGTMLYGYVFFGFLMQILLAALNPQIYYNVLFLIYPLVIFLAKHEDVKTKIV